MNVLIYLSKSVSIYLSAIGMIGKVVEIKQWDKTEGKVLINGELWNAVCEVPLPTGGKAIVQSVEGLTLKLKPYQD